MVFTVLGRFETSQGLLCNLSGVPGTYEKHMVFMALGRRGPSRGVLLALFAAPGSFLAGSWGFSVICVRFSWGPGPPNFVVFAVLGRCEASQGLLLNHLGSPEPIKNTWFSWSWDVVGPPTGSHWLLSGSRLVPGQVFIVFIRIWTVFVGSGPS